MIKKTTLIIAGVLALILLTAGTAVAVMNLWSTTDVNDNVMENKYIEIALSGDGSSYTDFLDTIEYDTTISNAGATTTYTPRLTDCINADRNPQTNDNDASLISKKFYVTVSETNVVSGGGSSLYDLSITVTDFVAISGVTYYITAGLSNNEYEFIDSITSSSQEYDAVHHTATWTVSGLTYAESYIVAMYANGETTADPGASLGFTNHTNNDVGSIFTFTATSVA